MVFEWLDEGKFHRVPKLEPGPPNVYFGKNPSSHNPFSGFCLSKSKQLMLTGPPPGRRCFLHRVERRPKSLDRIYVPPRKDGKPWTRPAVRL
jgi:hypothetical protein